MSLFTIISTIFLILSSYSYSSFSNQQFQQSSIIAINAKDNNRKFDFHSHNSNKILDYVAINVAFESFPKIHQFSLIIRLSNFAMRSREIDNRLVRLASCADTIIFIRAFSCLRTLTVPATFPPFFYSLSLNRGEIIERGRQVRERARLRARRRKEGEEDDVRGGEKREATAWRSARSNVNNVRSTR